MAAVCVSMRPDEADVGRFSVYLFASFVESCTAYRLDDEVDDIGSIWYLASADVSGLQHLRFTTDT